MPCPTLGLISSNARRCAVRRRYPAAHVAARALYARRFLSSGGGHFVQCPPHFFEGAPWWCPPCFFAARRLRVLGCARLLVDAAAPVRVETCVVLL